MKLLKIINLCLIGILLTQCQPTANKVEYAASEEGDQLIPVPFNQVQLKDGFWKPRLNTQAQTLVPFALDKTIPAVENLEKAARFLKGDTTDLPFPHRFVSSDLYKVMEGAAYLLMDNRDPELEQRMDSIIDIIASAQKEDGYLYVAHITGVSKNHDHWGGGGMGDKPYSFVLHSHELYNVGHMYEAAIAYYLATGKDKWLNVAEKSAQHINQVFFEGDPDYNNGKPVNQAPGHQELELALTKLYRVTGNELYLDMAKKFLDIRGRTYIPEGEGVMSATYSQQHKPVTEQKEAVGHAVRAAYMYSAMADVGALSGTDEYNQALNSIWHNIVDTKMHITGGLGAVHGIEGFGPEYVLPNKEAYNETCAAVGNVFFNFRMFLLTRDAKFMDVAEISLLNNSLAGVNIEGNKFFYVNPLEADGHTPFNHGHPGRSPWFNTACCPSNIARLMPQVSGMMYAYTADEIYASFYASNSTAIPLEEGEVNIEQESEYPFDGNVKLTLYPESSQQFTLKLRVPTWARTDRFVPGDLYRYLDGKKEDDWAVKINGKVQQVDLDKGFAVIDRKWEPGDEVELVLPMDVRFNVANEKIESDKDRVAITRGPLVYCAEGVDNDGPVQRLLLKDIPEPHEITSSNVNEGILQNIVAVNIPVHKLNPSASEKVQARLIPYYAWNNRDNGSMIVWLPIKEEQVQYVEDDIARGGKFKSVQASFTGGKGSLSAISDKRRPTSSNDRTKQSWVSEPQKGNPQWVEIELDKKPIRSIGVYWYEDGRNIKVPESWSLECKADNQWKDFNIYVTDSYSIDKDEYNVVHPGSNLVCDAIRINIIPQNDKSVGILDVDVVFETVSKE
jgi:DUF1680 family protein